MNACLKNHVFNFDRHLISTALYVSEKQPTWRLYKFAKKKVEATKRINQALCQQTVKLKGSSSLNLIAHSYLLDSFHLSSSYFWIKQWR